MALSTLNGGAAVYGLYNTAPGALTLTTGQFMFSVARITGTQQILLIGSARLRVI